MSEKFSDSASIEIECPNCKYVFKIVLKQKIRGHKIRGHIP